MCCTADCLQFFFKFVKYFVYMESLSLFCSMFIHLALTTDISLTLALFNLLSLSIFLSIPLNSLLLFLLYLSTFFPSFTIFPYFPLFSTLSEETCLRRVLYLYHRIEWFFSSFIWSRYYLMNSSLLSNICMWSRYFIVPFFRGFFDMYDLSLSFEFESLYTLYMLLTLMK